MTDLAGHSALITGSTGGVGLAIAVAMANAGANIVLHGIDDATAPDALAACKATGVRVSLVTADLALPTAQVVPALFDATVAADPAIDILVNNAGKFFDVPFHKMTVDRFEQTMRLNVQNGYFLTQAFTRRWTESGVAGRVLFTGSINGRLAEVGSTAYDTSKGAVEMMVRTLAVSLASQGIRVNGIAPGLVRTPQTRWIDKRSDAAQWITHHTPNGQIPSADVCGPMAAFLCSDAASHITGQMILIDGGASCQQQPPQGDYQLRDSSAP